MCRSPGKCLSNMSDFRTHMVEVLDAAEGIGPGYRG